MHQSVCNDHVSALSASEDKNLLSDICEKYDLQLRGSEGEHSDSSDGKYDISNRQRLGFTEVQLVQKLIDGVSAVIEVERLLEEGMSAKQIRDLIDVN